jgi:AraC-like DNA-binding protein
VADLLTFSTDAFVDDDKIPAWREVFGRSVVKMEMEPVRGEPFRSKARIDCLPGLTIASIASTANRVIRTPHLVADGSDDFVFALMTKGEATISQRQRDVAFRAGQAVLWSNASTGVCDYGKPIDFVALVVPRAQVAIGDIDRSLMRLLPDHLSSMKLLSRYLSILADGQLDGMTPELRALCAAHLRDLVALAVGATREAEQIANVRGVPAARLAALKADIVANITQRNLSADVLAARHEISPIYVRKLFERDGTSLSQYVLEQRLDRAFRLLANPRPIDLSIGSIAFDCGFGDLSYFNRCFRQRYGATPSDIRAGGRGDAPARS